MSYLQDFRPVAISYLEDLFSIEEYKSEGPEQAPNTSSITSYLEDLYEDSNILRRHKTCTVSEVLFLRHLELAAEGEGKYFCLFCSITCTSYEFTLYNIKTTIGSLKPKHSFSISLRSLRRRRNDMRMKRRL